MRNSTVFSRRTLVLRCIVPLLMVSAAAQAAAAEVNGGNVSFALCRNEASAAQYTLNKDGSWKSLTDKNEAAKFSVADRDDWSIYLISSNGKGVWIDTWRQQCQVTLPNGNVQNYTLEKSAAL
ncbi:MAG TPA: hypothetical protein VLA61_27970 [Ideonella sp.]|uniref:hypothetical protein n=1 Tax=Ideonella sp. TaxID=1929293 RepID=UPI002BDB9552|nr:hypothetical protein [Ideonella sp.]HSI52122.1 hypothetical protein [Ideonella sp.]